MGDKSSVSQTYIATAPSNIALVKYWGKIAGGEQLATNDSLSMTLENAKTTTAVRILQAALTSDTLIRTDLPKDSALQLSSRDEIYFDGQLMPRPDHSRQSKYDSKLTDSSFFKAYNHLHRLRMLLTGAGNNRQSQSAMFSLQVETSNSFPTSAGIASSASGLAALTLGALACWTGSASFSDLERQGFPRNRLADLARLGSGSAGRSLYGGFVRWRTCQGSVNQSFEPLRGLEQADFSDIIVLVDATKKTVPSSLGHPTAVTSPLFATRLAGVEERLNLIEQGLRMGNLCRIGRYIEDEALEMHSVMMTSSPPQKYIGTATSRVLECIRKGRSEGKAKMWFTLDAGSNVHVLTPRDQSSRVQAYLAANLPDHELYLDGYGSGPTLKIGQAG